MNSRVLAAVHRAISFRRARLAVSVEDIVRRHPSLSRGAWMALALVLTLSAGQTPLTASGNLDPTFGTGGKVITD